MATFNKVIVLNSYKSDFLICYHITPFILEIDVGPPVEIVCHSHLRPLARAKVGNGFLQQVTLLRVPELLLVTQLHKTMIVMAMVFFRRLSSWGGHLKNKITKLLAYSVHYTLLEPQWLLKSTVHYTLLEPQW